MSFSSDCFFPNSFLPKGLYIHVPFCTSRCPYCDFYVIVSRNEQQHLRFVQRLLEQLDHYLALRPDLLRDLQTIFLGGGTPSLLGARALSYLLRELQARLPKPVTEWSMESNPELIHAESLELWQNLNINRLSIGLQSCSDKLLLALGRRSSRQEHEKLAKLLTNHFNGQYSFDFIYGIPGQNLADIEDSLDFIARHQPHHVSYYELSIEEGTLFARQQIQTVAQQNCEQQFEHLHNGLKKLDYYRYEVSNFACGANGNAEEHLYCSRHNELYWRWQPYLGLGPGAVGAGLITEQPGQQAQVWRAQGSTVWQHYLERSDFGLRYTILSQKESLWEYLLMALRLRRGIEGCEFSHLFWPNLPAKAEYLDCLLQKWLPNSMQQYADFFYWEQGYFKLTDVGFDLQGSFLRAAYQELSL